MAGEHLDPVRELEQPVERVEEPFGALDRAHREIGAGRVADEEGIARQHEPRLVPARMVDDGQAAVLRPVARRVDHAQRDRADRDLVAVLERVVRVVDPRGGVDADGDTVLEGEPAVAGDVVGVRVRLDGADDPKAAPLRLGEQWLDLERGVDERGDSRLLVADQVTRAPEIVVQELVEDHDATVAPGVAISPEVRQVLRSARCAVGAASVTRMPSMVIPSMLQSTISTFERSTSAKRAVAQRRFLEGDRSLAVDFPGRGADVLERGAADLSCRYPYITEIHVSPSHSSRRFRCRRSSWLRR